MTARGLIFTFTLSVAVLACAEGVGVTEGGPGSGAGTASSGVGGTSSGTSTGTGTGTGTSSSSGSGGCQAVPDLTTAGDACENAIPLGVLSDASAESISVSGNGVHDSQAIWWSFEGADDPDTAGDEYHVDIRFLDNPGSAYMMDVYRGGCASEDRIASGETDAFDWYTDFASTDVGCSGPPPCGEGDCVPSGGEEFCHDDTATFFVRIGTVNGLDSCDAFELEMSNGVH